MRSTVARRLSTLARFYRYCPVDGVLSRKPAADQAAATELRGAGARPRWVVLTGLSSLTASERRIAELASQGLTNREIAQTLFVTARTVEGHLTSAFHKLQLSSRDELPAARASDAPGPTKRPDILRAVHKAVERSRETVTETRRPSPSRAPPSSVRLAPRGGTAHVPKGRTRGLAPTSSAGERHRYRGRGGLRSVEVRRG
jgi:DNA-binding CsgD family transcriptional regulator